MKKVIKILKVGIISAAIMAIFVFGINIFVVLNAKSTIVAEEDYESTSKVDCILVLGAGIWGDSPSPMLEDRLLECIKLYEAGVSDKIIMSGDNGSDDYNEVKVMKDYVVEKGIPAENVFMDHAGFSTYESMYRAKEVFKAESVMIVTQNYHLYRAVYIAKRLGLTAYGAGADPRRYKGAAYREIREVLARDKDFLKCIFKPEPKYLGDAIPVSGTSDGTEAF